MKKNESTTKPDSGFKPIYETRKKKTPENTTQNEQIITLPIDKLVDFDDHPFSVTQDEDFKKLTDSIKENGVLLPAVARPKGNSYELISGHRRRVACQSLGIETMPVLIRELSNEQAILAMIDSNIQRENILPSEKAFAYKMKLDALKRQSGRPKDNSVQLGQNLKGKVSRDLLAENSSDSSVQIQRYIRLTELNPQLLEMVDEKKIAFNPAVELSYLPKEHQELLLSVMDAEQATPSLSQAQRLKSLSNENKLNENSVTDIMREQKSNQKEQLRIPYDKVKAILKKDISPKELEDIVLKLLADYQRKLIKERNRDAR